MTRYYPTINHATCRITVVECELKHDGKIRYVCDGGHGWRRFDGELFETRDDAIVHGIFLLRAIVGRAELGINDALKELPR